DGLQIQLADIFDPDSTVALVGDFSGGVPTAEVGNDATFTIVDASSGTATFDAFDVAGMGTFAYFVSGDAAIAESQYTAALDAVANAGYEVSDVGPIVVGEITRNGTQLQAPLAQVPGGWLSRIVLTNTGSTARPYELSIMG